MTTDGWYATRLLEPGVHLISEPVNVNSFLVEGLDRSVLIDSGRGIGSIDRVVRGLTSLPTSVINTHYHYDHSGGNRLFSSIAIHGEAMGWVLTAADFKALYNLEHFEAIALMESSKGRWVLTGIRGGQPEVALAEAPDLEAAQNLIQVIADRLGAFDLGRGSTA